MTEIHDYLRLMFARVGKPHCPKCGKLISQQTVETVVVSGEDAQEEVPVWAQVSLTAMQDNGIHLQYGQSLTRGEMAQVMYQVSRLALTAPGMSAIRMQQ